MSTTPKFAVKKSIKSGVNQGIGVFFGYETSKIVQISSIKVGIIYRIIQLSIIAYIIGWVFIYKKGYQDFEDVVSGVTTKVKGVQYTNLTGTSIGARIWDVADYVVPPQENGAFFITTNAIVTKDQTQGACDEDPGVAPCQTDADCPAGSPQMLGNGVNTGRCVASSQRPGTKSCEILAWCPVEVDHLPTRSTIFPNAVNFTVLIKNSIEFPKFGIKRRNIQEWYNASQLSTCIYNANSDPYCPTFRIGDILAMTGSANYSDIAREGGIVSIHINWDCNLDLGESHCQPTYQFRRLDNPLAKIARGWNFRHAHYYQLNGTDRRLLIKACGLRFVIFVTGQAGKFNMVPLAKNLGSSLALLCIATILCDLILICATPTKRRRAYRNAKYQILLDKDSLYYKLRAHAYDEEAEAEAGDLMEPADQLGDRDSLPQGYGAVSS